MKYEQIMACPLFRGCNEQDLREMAARGDLRTAGFEKGDTICRMGELVREIGLVLEGSVRIENGDVWGNRSILGIVGPGGVFAEAYACLPDEPLLVSVVANERCRILFLSAARLFASEEPCHRMIRRNLLMISARKNVQLSRRMFLTSAKTIRERLMAYFSGQIALHGSRTFDIPFDRQQLADYLNLDRSALSKELGKMKREGLLDYRKNHFVIHTD